MGKEREYFVDFNGDLRPRKTDKELMEELDQYDLTQEQKDSLFKHFARLPEELGELRMSSRYISPELAKIVFC